MKKIFSFLAAVLFAGSMMASEAIMQYSGGVTTNMVGDGANNAATVGLDADLFTVLADKGSNQNLPGLNKNNDIRLYADKTTGNGNTITVSIASGTITSIVLDIKQTATFVVKAGETAVTEEDGAYAINAASFSIQNTTSGASTQLQLNKITINYTAEGGGEPVEPGDEPSVLQAVSDSTTWDFSKITANTENALYKKEGIQLTDESTPSKNDEVIYADYSADFMTIGEDFNKAAIAFKGEYPIRKNQYCQAGTLHFKADVAGTIVVKFSDTGSSASATAVKRYLVVNGVQTEEWTSRENNGETPYDAQLNVVSGKIAVPAGDVTITGSSAIVVYYVTFVPAADEPVEPTMDYYVAGSMGVWGPDEAYRLTPSNNGEYEGEFTFAANDEFKVIGYDGTTVTWFPEGMNNNYVITEAGDYKITFNPAGNVEGWYAGYYNVVKEEEPVLADPTNCAEAAEAALSVAANNELYNGGKEYSITGYVTSIQTAFSAQHSNISFWMADAADGGNVIQAYRAACASVEEAPAVGDKVAVTGKLTKYNSTPEFAAGCTYVITEPYIPVEPEINYYVAGSMGVWGPDEAYRLTPSNNGEYEGEFTFAANDEFKVIGYDGTTVTWFPEGMNNNYVITEAGDYKITFNPAGNVEGWYAGFFNVVKKEAPIVHQYEVAEAIAAGLQENDEVLVRGIITRMEFKGANFAKYGSVNIYVADATDAEGEFEFYNCYSLNADTFRTSIPNYDPADKNWAQFNEVADANGNAIHVGDTVIAFGKYKLYNSTHELNTGCYLVDIKSAPVAPGETIELAFTDGGVDNRYYANYGSTDIQLYNIPVVGGKLQGDGDYLQLEIYPADPNDISGEYSIEDEGLDDYYTYLMRVNGTDTTEIEFVSGSITVSVQNPDKETSSADITVQGQLITAEGDVYVINSTLNVYYNFTISEDEKYKFDEAEAEFNYNFDTYQILPTGSDVVVGVMAQTDQAMIAAMIVLPQGQTELVAGEYAVSVLPMYGTVMAGQYTADGPQPSYAMMSAGKLWYFVSGKVTVEGDGSIVIDALNSNGKAIKSTLNHLQGEGIDEVNAAVKATKTLKNGQLIIEKAGVKYNAQGAVIR